MFAFQEYQLQIPTPSPRILTKISEQSQNEEQQEWFKDRIFMRTKTSKFESKVFQLHYQQQNIGSTKIIQTTTEKLPRLPSSKQSGTTKIIRSITDHQSPPKQLTIKTFKTNTENDEILTTDDERTRSKFKRDDLKRITTNYKAGLLDNPAQKRISEQIFHLVHQLNALKEYLNNSRKMFLVIRNVVGNKKSLRKLLIKHGKEELVEFSDIPKLCSIKEFITLNGEQKLIEKLNVTLLDDIVFANESIENLLVQNQIQGIKRIADQVYSISHL